MSDLDAYFEMLHTDRRMAEWAESERNEQEWWERLTPIERWIVEQDARLMRELPVERSRTTKKMC
jgi:L-rhamnose mutarotase